MVRVFMSRSTGAGVYVFSDDHCPPHVHVRHRGEGWSARVQFSFLEEQLEVLSIAPLRNTPLQRTVNGLLDDIEAELLACRCSWWAVKRTTCLENQLAAILTETTNIIRNSPSNTKRIASAAYDPDRDVVRIAFQDGTRLDVNGRS
jgi:hypothetical protein